MVTVPSTPTSTPSGTAWETYLWSRCNHTFGRRAPFLTRRTRRTRRNEEDAEKYRKRKTRRSHVSLAAVAVFSCAFSASSPFVLRVLRVKRQRKSMPGLTVRGKALILFAGRL